MPLYRKKPVVIEAVKWTGFNLPEVQKLASPPNIAYHRDGVSLLIWNIPEDCWVKCPVGHWVIKGVKGEVYPCEDEIFNATYESA